MSGDELGSDTETETTTAVNKDNSTSPMDTGTSMTTEADNDIPEGNTGMSHMLTGNPAATATSATPECSEDECEEEDEEEKAAKENLTAALQLTPKKQSGSPVKRKDPTATDKSQIDMDTAVTTDCDTTVNETPNTTATEADISSALDTSATTPVTTTTTSNPKVTGPRRYHRRLPHPPNPVGQLPLSDTTGRHPQLPHPLFAIGPHGHPTAHLAVLMKRRRINLTLQEKIDLINQLEAGVKQSIISKNTNIPKSTLCRIWKDKSKVEEQLLNMSSKRKRIRKLAYSEIDSALIEWYKVSRAQHHIVNGPILLAQAQHFAKIFGKSDFKASDGWLDKFKKRHDIVFRAGGSMGVDDKYENREFPPPPVSTIPGAGSHSVPGMFCIPTIPPEGLGGSASEHDPVDDWVLNKWPDMCRDYTARDIFNCDESGLFYKLIPDKSGEFPDDTCDKGERPSERLTILFCCNSDGSEKRKLLVIGKPEKPKVSKNGTGSIPVEYFENIRAWMNKDIFDNWLRRLDIDMGTQRRKILLTLDNVSAAHPTYTNLKNIKLVYFPTQYPPYLQPLDQGIIQNVKMKYRNLIIHKTLRMISEQIEPDTNLLDCLLALNSAWTQVKDTTISNCFRHSRLIPIGRMRMEDLYDDTDDYDEDNIPLVEMAKVLKFQNVPSVAEYVNFDNDVATSQGPLTPSEIIANSYSKISNEQLNAMDKGSKPEVVLPEVTSSSAMEAIETLNLWLVSQENIDSSVFGALSHIETHCADLHARKLKDARLADYLIHK